MVLWQVPLSCVCIRNRRTKIYSEKSPGPLEQTSRKSFKLSMLQEDDAHRRHRDAIAHGGGGGEHEGNEGEEIRTEKKLWRSEEDMAHGQFAEHKAGRKEAETDVLELFEQAEGACPQVGENVPALSQDAPDTLIGSRRLERQQTEGQRFRMTPIPSRFVWERAQAQYE